MLGPGQPVGGGGIINAISATTNSAIPHFVGRAVLDNRWIAGVCFVAIAGRAEENAAGSITGATGAVAGRARNGVIDFGPVLVVEGVGKAPVKDPGVAIVRVQGIDL